MSTAIRSTAEIEADFEKLRREKRMAEERDRLEVLEKRRARMGETTMSSMHDGSLLVPASPSPKKKSSRASSSAREALMNPLQAKASSKRKYDGDMYSLPRLNKDPSASRSVHPVASRKNGNNNLADMLDNEVAQRLAPKHKLAPSSLLDASHLARKSLKDAEGRRGIATHRSTAFHDPAPPPKRTTNQASTSTQPIPSYNAGYKGSSSSRYKETQYASAVSARTGSSSHSRGHYKGKSIDRSNGDYRSRYQEETEPATRHSWQSRTSTSNTTTSNTKENDGDNGYYSFEEEDNSRNNEFEENGNEDDDDDDENAYQDIPYKPIGNERNDDLTLVHRLRPGPRRFKVLESDPGFESVEPNSKIRLSKRILPHSELQEHLSDRFYLPHDILYSIVRPSKGGLEYEVPVEGDWIVIGVLAEKSEIKYTGSNNNSHNTGQNAALKQLEWRKKMQDEKKEKAKQLAREKARAKFSSDNGGQGGLKNEPFDDSLFEEMIKSDDELKEAFEGSDGGEGISLDSNNKKKGESSKGKSEKMEGRYEQRTRRYITFKLIDLGKKDNASSGTGILSLKLFESDPDLRRKSKSINENEEEIETVYNKKTGKRILVNRTKGEQKLARKKAKSDNSTNNNGGDGSDNGDNDDEDEEGDRFDRKEYKGGSGGAFEKFWKELNGTVVAILNPRIMKPWQNPYMQNSSNANILSLTPESADSVIVIGKAKDLGSCQAKKKDGNLCASWCDTRIDNVCDYHIAQAVNRRRAGRAELLSGTGGMQTTHISGDISSLNPSSKKHNPTSNHHHSGKMFSGGTSYSAPYDPINKIGLLPRNNTSVQEGAKTYVVSTGPPGGARGLGSRNTGGYITAAGVSRSSANGAYRTDPATRPYDSAEKKQLDPRELAKKKKREKQSVEHLLAIEGGKSVGAHYLGANRKINTRGGKNMDASPSGMDGEEDSELDNTEHEGRNKKRRVFGVDSLRKIGFDPTAMPALMDAKQQQRKIEAIQALDKPESYEPKLGPHVGKKHSNVHKPASRSPKHSEMHQSSSDDDDDDGFRPIKRHSKGETSKQDSGFQDSGSESGLPRHTKQEISNHKHVANQFVSNVANQEDEESDLEIEPPAAV